MTDAQENLPALPAVRIADSDRAVTARLLQHAVEEGRLDVFELDQRLVAVYSAQTPTELATLTADLPAVAAAREPLELRTGSGTREKHGHWIVPADITLECRSGSIRLDFTQAVCPSQEVAIHVSVSSGSIRLIVPPGWQVDFDRLHIKSGSAKSKLTAPRLPGSPLLRIDGKVRTGSIVAKYPSRTFWAWLLRRPRPA